MKRLSESRADLESPTGKHDTCAVKTAHHFFFITETLFLFRPKDL